jgi:hypothetical protein
MHSELNRGVAQAHREDLMRHATEARRHGTTQEGRPNASFARLFSWARLAARPSVPDTPVLPDAPVVLD